MSPRSISSVSLSFNSRTREGCDLASDVLPFMRDVSIHAPGRGATAQRYKQYCLHLRFQFTHPGGVRPQPLNTAAFVRMFQFTHPGGVRLFGVGCSLTAIPSFNSRTREGCDSDVLPFMRDELFQFTHPGGVRQVRDRKNTTIYPFQFTHPGGVRLHTLRTQHNGRSFNSRTREGCDIVPDSDYSAVGMFQFTHPGGVRQCGAKLRIMGRINKRNLRLEVLL